MMRGVPMDALVALAPRLGADAAACVALCMKRMRREAAIRLQAVARRRLAQRMLIRRVMLEVAWLLERNRFAAPAVEKALPGLKGQRILAQFRVIRVLVVG